MGIHQPLHDTRWPQATCYASLGCTERGTRFRPFHLDSSAFGSSALRSFAGVGEETHPEGCGFLESLHCHRENPRSTRWICN